MFDVSINYLAVLVAAVAGMVVGAFWYSNALFAKQWMSALGKSEEQVKAEGKSSAYLWTALFTLLTAYVLAHFIAFIGADSVFEGITTAFWAWLGFVFTTHATNYLFEARSFQLLWITSLHHLVVMAVMAIILVLWL